MITCIYSVVIDRATKLSEGYVGVQKALVITLSPKTVIRT